MSRYDDERQARKHTRTRRAKGLSLAVVLAAATPLFSLALPLTASAQEEGHTTEGHDGHTGGGGYGGYRGGRDDGSGHGGHDDEEHSDHEEGEDHGGGHGGRGGRHGSDSGGEGGGGYGGYRGGDNVEGSLRGGRPPWAQEGIPEVELGRLNVARAPRHVLDRAGSEALATWQAAMAELYGMSAEDAAALLAANYRDVVRYDSPLQNLALYRDLMTFGGTELAVTPASQLDLAAILLGSASDKNIPVSEDTVIALHIILGLDPLSDTERAILAAKAEAVRQGILTGHGPTEELE